MPSGRGRFYQVLSDGITDFTEHGFDSKDRLQRWLGELRRTATDALVPESVLVRQLRSHLEKVFRRSTAFRDLRRRHQLLPSFTIEQIQPSLRTELQRAILASADLITLNREASIQRTLQRFAGWASSIPAGGSRAVDRRKTADSVRRSIAGLPFEERRVITDQGHKLSASIDRVIGKAGGAIAVLWRHVKEGPPAYDARPEHVARDGKIFVLRDNWALRGGFMKLGGHQYYDQISAAAEEPFCFPGDSKVPFAYGVSKAYRRWYSGAMIEFISVSGKALRATPNHPVLTPGGWKAIGSLNVGDEIIEITDDGLSTLEENQSDRGIPSIADIFSSLKEGGVTESLDLTPAGFHGDGSYGQVDVVAATRRLYINWQANRIQRFREFTFSVSDSCRTPFSNIGSALFCMTAAVSGLVRGCGNSLSAFFSDPFHAQRIGVRNGTHVDSGRVKACLDSWSADAYAPGYGEKTFALKEGFDFSRWVKKQFRLRPEALGKSNLFQAFKRGGARDTEDGGNLIDRLPFSAKPSKLVFVNRYLWSGHVFNLETADGWYAANGVIIHNCRCWAQYIYSLNDLPPEMLTAKGQTALSTAA
jgi:hypothetical protein